MAWSKVGSGVAEYGPHHLFTIQKWMVSNGESHEQMDDG